MTELLYTPSFSKMFIGLDTLLNELNQPRLESSYPPFNLIKKDENHYVLELAVAGFAPENISVKTENGWLTISSVQDKTETKNEPEYLHQGIASRQFTRSFKLYENVFATGANFKNGILSVSLEHRVPEHLKPQTIKILEG